MKKLSAILLISIFALSQYARQFDYFQCKFLNTFKSSKAKCDCEKQVGADKQSQEQVPAPKIHNHIHLDEFFSIAKGYIGIAYLGDSNSCISLCCENECEGMLSSPWRPPNS